MAAAFRVACLDHVAIRSRDPAASARWYQDVLGLVPAHVGRWDGVPLFIVSPGHPGTGVAIFPADSEADPGEPLPALRLDHLAFRVTGEAYAAAVASFAARGIEAEEQDHDIARSVYLKDPDGHTVELTTYIADG